MRFAIFEDNKIEASPGATGTCYGCKSQLVAKCGTQNIWHWAHKGRGRCDPWWEPETRWHRSWKDRFPKSWQEFFFRGYDGEMHFADVRIPSGVVIEFQHSYIEERERRAREQFYGNLIWVVDGTRLKRDRLTFLSGMSANRGLCGDPEQLVFNGSGRKITKRWADSECFVCLDFDDDDLWCVSPYKSNWQFFATCVSKDEFTDAFCNGQVPGAFSRLPRS
jgi:competence protein CoiA